MRNITFLSLIHIISTTFDVKNACEEVQFLCDDSFGSAQSNLVEARTSSNPCILLDFMKLMVRKKRTFTIIKAQSTLDKSTTGKPLWRNNADIVKCDDPNY